ncbi:MAG: hypothetical protein JWR84_1864 [Caulobacter sp.]|nr:hypothetical protein [Caulobacter sp.]
MRGRKRQNVWRVYMDLFANFLGLVLIGGAGVMIMVGGAVVHAQSGPAALAKNCRGGRELWTRLPEFMAQAGQLPGKIDSSTCSVEVLYPAIIFPKSQDVIPGSSQAMEETFCRHVFETVGFLETNKIVGGTVEILGGTSEEFEKRGACQTKASADRELLKRCPDCRADIREAAQRSLKEDNVGAYDLALCNGPLAARRAAWAQRVCFDWAAANMDQMSIKPEVAARRVYSSVKIGADLKSDCTTAVGAPNCFRTVSIKLRLPAKKRR